jgi:hypothetical protein
MERSKKVVDTAWAVQEVSGTLVEIDALIGKQDFESVTQVVASARQALVDIQARGAKATPKQFELLYAHGHSIGVVLKENADTAGVLVSALEKAVAAIKAEPGAPVAAAVAPKAPTEPVPAPDQEPEPEAADPCAPTSLRTRLRAWWNGVDPEEVEATAE